MCLLLCLCGSVWRLARSHSPRFETETCGGRIAFPGLAWKYQYIVYRKVRVVGTSADNAKGQQEGDARSALRRRRGGGRAAGGPRGWACKAHGKRRQGEEKEEGFLVHSAEQEEKEDIFQFITHCGRRSVAHAHRHPHRGRART